MGNRNLRKLLVLGAYAALYGIKNGKTRSPLVYGVSALLVTRTFKLVAVALANK